MQIDTWKDRQIDSKTDRQIGGKKEIKIDRSERFVDQVDQKAQIDRLDKEGRWTKIGRQKDRQTER